MFCVISHGTSVPEHGFSIDELLLEAYGYILQVDTIEAKRLMLNSSVTKFPIKKKLISEIKYVCVTHLSLVARKTNRVRTY